MATPGLRRIKSEQALDVDALRLQSRGKSLFQSSVPHKHFRVVDGQYSDSLYEYHTITTKNDRGRVCLRCLRWSLTTATSPTIFSDAEKKQNDVSLAQNWGFPVEMMDSECPMCRLFAMHASDYQSINGPMQGRSYDLREVQVTAQPMQLSKSSSVQSASAAKFWYLDPNSAPRSNFPSPAGRGACIGLTDLNPVAGGGVLGAVLTEPDAVDYSAVRGWLSTCQLHHSGDCSLRSSEILPSLQLIDCLSTPPKVIKAQPQHKYVALSYVWGTGAVESHLSGDTLVWKLLPRTIRDAMTVTRKLGLRYLWVDRYCIPPVLLQEQISKMDIIYTDASLVIVAAAGETIDYGLPGVGARHRAQQPYAVVGKDIFTSTLADLDSILYTIPWSKRAWCFQEALLSRRRLIFTDEKVYFFCRQMLVIETLSLPFYDSQDRPQANRTGSSSEFYKWLSASGLLRSNPEQIYQILAEYARKDMSFDSDGLNAIVGVLRAFSNADEHSQFHSYAGLPILGSPSRQAFLTAFMWGPHIPTRRRAGDFPSWSWIGWTGGLLFNEISRDVDADIEIRLVQQDGCTIDWDDFVSAGRLKDTVFPLSRYIELHIQTTVVQVSYLTTSSIQHGGAYVIPLQRFPGGKARYAQIALNYDAHASGKLDSKQHRELTTTPSTCMLLIPPDHERKLYGIGCLLCPVGDVLELIGSFQLDYLGYIYDADGNNDEFLMDTDPRATIEGFADLKREWIRLG